MSIVNTLDRITEWTQKNICDPVSFKVPPKDKEPEGTGYQYERIKPTAFKWFIPTKDRLPPEVKTSFPSACVRINDGEDTFNSRTMNLDICFSVWNPGLHGSDIIDKMEDGSYTQWKDTEAIAFYQRDNEGWREVWNWVDLALRALESTTDIYGIKIDRSSIKFAPFKVENDMVDFYPFWYAYISFTVETPLERHIPDWEGLL